MLTVRRGLLEQIYVTIVGNTIRDAFYEVRVRLAHRVLTQSTTIYRTQSSRKLALIAAVVTLLSLNYPFQAK